MPEPIVVPTPETPAAPAAPPPTPAEAVASADAAAESAALAILVEARAAREAPPPPPPAEAEAPPPVSAPPAPPSAPGTPATSPAPPGSETERLLARLNAVEETSRRTAAENKTLREAAAKAAKWEAAAKAATDGDISAVAQELGWTPDAILKYIENGQEGVKDVVADKKVAAVASEVEALKTQLAQERAQREVVEYKGTISRVIPEISAAVPFLVNDYTDPETGVVNHAGITEAIFDLQYRLHTASEPRSITIQEAATALNAARENQLKRLQGKPATPPAPVPPATAPKAAPPAPKLSPGGSKAPIAKSPDEESDPDLADALAILRAAKAQRRAARAE